MGCKLGDCVAGDIVVYDHVEPMLVTFTKQHDTGNDNKVIIVFSGDGCNQILKFIVQKDFEYAGYINVNDWVCDAT